MDAIEVKNISKIFKGRFKALDNISLNVKRGEIYGLLGPNGAGKTTLVNILATLLYPTEGSAKILGMDVVKQANDIRKKIGICFGDTRFFWSFKVREILKYYGMLAGIHKQERDKKIQNLVDKVGIRSFYNKQFNSLSKGMKQKVALVKCLISDPEVILMDEPTSGLDVDVAIKTRNILNDLTKEGKTILLTSHNMHEVEALCKNITVINRGRVITEGNIKKIKEKIKFSDTISLVLNKYSKLDFLRKIKGFHGYDLKDNRLNVRVESSKDSISHILNSINKNGYKIIDLEIRDISLEEVFLKLVGENNA